MNWDTTWQWICDRSTSQKNFNKIRLGIESSNQFSHPVQFLMNCSMRIHETAKNEPKGLKKKWNEMIWRCNIILSWFQLLIGSLVRNAPGKCIGLGALSGVWLVAFNGLILPCLNYLSWLLDHQDQQSEIVVLSSSQSNQVILFVVVSMSKNIQGGSSLAAWAIRLQLTAHALLSGKH